MRDIPCSVGMLTYNSGKTLRRVLESVKDFDDIILCDGGSTDDTLKIAAEYGARVIPQDAKYKYPNNRLADGGGARNQMINAAKNDWFLMLDSDESISEGLHDDIARISRKPVQTGDALAYRVPIRIFIDGRPILHSSNYPGYQPRFYNRKSGARYVRAVHNRMEFSPNVRWGVCRNPWFVYVSRSDIHIFGAERKHYRHIEVKEVCSLPTGAFVKTLLWQLRAAAVIVVKSLWIYCRYGFAHSMPIEAEIGRTVGPLMLIVKSVKCRFLRMFARA